MEAPYKMLDLSKNALITKLMQVLLQAWAMRPAIQRRMNKRKWSAGIDLRPLSGEEWLRLLAGETVMAAFVGWCVRCRLGECVQESCQRCGTALLKFDDPFWSQIGRKIRRAIRKDRTLLSRVKSERESLYGPKHMPIFPSALEWLGKLWKQTPQPPHQAFNPKSHYAVANWIEALQGLGLSQQEIIEVLGDGDLPESVVPGRGRDYGQLSHADLLTLRKDFRQAVGSLPSSVKHLSDMCRTVSWVHRQRTVPMARLRGERVRKENPAGD